ncbi:MAG: excinuclease ABC subunit UvrC [Parachlamydiales bacterium]|nr:excinuclease ABC subunit UvrC [Parachlamydiales bacterium]
MPFDVKKLDLFPTKPGVYLMRDKKGDVIYIGKAKVLKQRIKQYFVPGRDSRPVIPYLVAKIESIETIVVTSEKEALFLESNLIKKHQPNYNALLKDDKTYISLKINTKHNWPMVQLVRIKGKPPTDGLYFGPYINAYAARKTLELIKKLFPLRSCSDRELSIRKRPCILHQMKRCVAPCVNLCTKEGYDRLVKNTVQFLRGNDKGVLKTLYAQMESASENLAFEEAAGILRTIKQIELTLEEQRVEKATRADTDAIGIYRHGDDAYLTLLFIRNGKLIGSRQFTFTKTVEEDDELLASFLLQFYGVGRELPQEILVPVSIESVKQIEDVLNENATRKLHILNPQKGDKRHLSDLANTNAKTSYEKEKDDKTSREKVLLEMQEKLRLTNFPKKIECFDNSHLSGTIPVASMVVFEDGIKNGKSYRTYHLRSADPSDDYGAMNEVLTRRYGKAKQSNNLPDCIIVDGGKGQLSTAVKVLESLDISTVDIIALAKDQGRHDRGATQERIFLRNTKDPVILRSNSSLLFLLQQIRDEAHRFAITFQRKQRKKKTIVTTLADIPGIGPVKQKLLLSYFGSAKRLKKAPQEELERVQGLSYRDVDQLLEWQKSET